MKLIQQLNKKLMYSVSDSNLVFYIKRTIYIVLFALSLIIASQEANAQFPSDTNETESKVIPYTLPDPLLMPDGKRVINKEQWIKFARPFIYKMFEDNVYGLYPKGHFPISYKLRDYSNQALKGIAIRKQIRIFLKRGDSLPHIDVLVYLPNDIKGPVPVFLGYNFEGNATIINDPDIILSHNVVYPEFKKANDSTDRGTESSRWPVKFLLKSGFGLVTACYSDIELDKTDGWRTGIRTTLKNELKISPDQWGAIGAWAWGLSRIMDYLEKDSDVNSNEVAVIGLSRLGKVALWAAASDPRFGMVISNESGHGGAALARRWFGETVKMINQRFPYWFVRKYKEYNNNVFALPVDQDELLDLIAPRALYVASAVGDPWSDPKGEFLSTWLSGEVYSLFGLKGLGTDIMPAANHPIGSNTVHYHIRTGKHNITFYDWEQYIKFAMDYWVKGRKDLSLK